MKNRAGHVQLSGGVTGGGGSEREDQRTIIVTNKKHLMTDSEETKKAEKTVIKVVCVFFKDSISCFQIDWVSIFIQIFIKSSWTYLANISCKVVIGK